MMYECNVETRARNASGLFDEGLLLAVLGKCLRLTVFSMVGFPFEHDEMLKRIGDRLAMTGVASRAAAAAAAAIGDETHVLNSHLSLSSTRPFLSSGIIKDPSLSASSTSSSISLIAPAVSAPTGLKRLELVNQHYCQVKAKSIEYLLNHCTADLEELLLSISFGSRAEVGSTTGHEADQLQGHEQGQEQDMEGMEQENSGSYQSHVDSSWIGHAKHKADETENDREWNMRRLVIKGDLSGSGPLIWLPLLRRCRRLKEIAVDLFTDMSLHQLACTLSQYCPEITEITLRCMTGGPQEDERIADLIRSSRSWKKLSMSYFHGLGSLSTAALIRHSATLETLALEECDGLTSEDIQAVLSSCPNLRIFKALTSNGKDFSTTVYLDANEMVDSPWACNRLECLKLIITGIARPDLQIDQYGQPLTGPLHDGTITGDEMHRIVYSQLGKLTRLRELWLGHDKQDLDDEDNYHSTDVEGQWQFIDPDEQFECLQFSIKSGMELLRGLKELRVLNLDRMKTRIGLSEVQWMVKHWPKLEKVIGLVIQGERVPKHVQWLYDHRPDIELPPVMGNFITAF
ncbi:hypothetical protein EDD11_004644 [Mortierella claussenii]|nr:hypothetical protein EDD11_004644 [Mortierella claussenii]